MNYLICSKLYGNSCSISFIFKYKIKNLFSSLVKYLLLSSWGSSSFSYLSNIFLNRRSFPTALLTDLIASLIGSSLGSFTQPNKKADKTTAQIKIANCLLFKISNFTAMNLNCQGGLL